MSSSTSSAEDAGYNITQVNLLLAAGKCTYETCPSDYAYFRHPPNLAGNAFFVAWHATFLIAQTALFIKYRTRSFFIAMFCGLVLEILGYTGRIMSHNDPFSQSSFLMYIVTLTIGPAFLSAAIYFCFAHVIRLYSSHISRFKPVTYSRIFICCDIIALILQSVGGGTIGGSGGEAQLQKSLDLLIAGLGFQVFSLCLYIVLVADFFWFGVRNGKKREGDGEQVLVEEWRGVRERKWWGYFLTGIAAATMCVLTRSIYRVAELSEGFNSSIANDETLYMVLEGMIIALAVLFLTIFHPGPAFAGTWNQTRGRFDLRGRKVKPGAETEEVGGHEESTKKSWKWFQRA